MKIRLGVAFPALGAENKQHKQVPKRDFNCGDGEVAKDTSAA